MAIVFMPIGLYFESPETMEAYALKVLHEEATNAAPHVGGYESAMDIFRQNGEWWDSFDLIRFHQSVNCRLIEINTKERRLYVGFPSHHFSIQFSSSLKAIKAGFMVARKAEEMEISLDSRSRDDVDRLWNAVAENF